jgi:hypothetical protein
MKKKFHILSLLPIFILTACGTSSLSETPAVAERPTFEKSGQEVLTDNLLKDNVSDLAENLPEFSYQHKTSYDIDFSSSKIQVSTYANYGLMLLRDTNTNTVHYYSAITSKYIYESKSTYNSVYNDVSTMDYIGFIVKISDGNLRLLIDAFGNILYQATNTQYSDFTVGIENGKVVATVTDASDNKIHFMYDEQGKAHQYDPSSSVSIGTQYDEELLSLEMHGYPNYHALLGNEHIAVFKDDVIINSYYVPVHSVIKGIISTKVVVQVKFPIIEDETNYDLIEGGMKYQTWLETFDLISGEVEVLNYGVYINNLRPLFENDMCSKYSYIEYSEITNKTLGTTEKYIIDKDFVLYDDLGHVSFGTVERLKENVYWDKESGVVYSDALKTKSYVIEKTVASYIQGIHMFELSLNGKYGLISPTGKVVAQPVYDTLYTNVVSNNSIIGVIGDEYYRISLYAGVATYIDSFTTFTEIDKGFYLGVNKEGHRVYFGHEKTFFTKEINFDYSRYYTNLLGNKKVLIIYKSYTYNVIKDSTVSF